MILEQLLKDAFEQMIEQAYAQAEVAYEQDSQVRMVLNRDLKAGMQTMKWEREHWVPDVKLRKVFPTSVRFPHIAFETENRHKVVYSPCGQTPVKFA